MRDELWKLSTKAAGEGSVIQLWSDRGPQGFNYRSHGEHDRVLVDVEGVTLVRRKRRPKPALASTPTDAMSSVAPESPEPTTVPTTSDLSETGASIEPAHSPKPGDPDFDLW